MDANPKTQEEWTLHSINIHGVFFERLCRDIISNSNGWNVISTNYPVEFPSANGASRGKESALDIRAIKELRNQRVNLLIECKKNNPDFVNWVFFKKRATEFPESLVVSCIERIFNIPPTSGWKVDTSIQNCTSSIPISDEAREVRSDYLNYKSGNKTKTSNAAIQEAAYQVVLATQAIVSEDAEFSNALCKSNEPNDPAWEKQFYFPIIVTSAKLFICDFQEKDIDVATGEISFDKANLIECNELVYEYSMPKHLQHLPENIVDVLKSESINMFIHKHIIIVTSMYFEYFINNFLKETRESK